MQKQIAGLCSVLGLGLLALAPPALAGGYGPFGIEKSLIGVRMLQSYKEVLHKFGPPTRVYRNDETVGLIEAYDNRGNPTGGILGFSDSLAMLGGGPAGGGAAGGMGGAPGGMSPGKAGMFGGMAGGPPGFPGGPGGMRGMMGGGPPGYPGGPGGMRGMMGGGPAGMPGGMAGGPAGFPGGSGGKFGMMPGMGGGFGGGTPPGAASASGGAGAPSPRVGSYIGGETFEDAGGFKWVYLYPKQQLLYEFIFNRDGRVEIILERGRGLGAPTSRGIRLGSSERAVMDTYGWPDNIEDEGVSFGFSYILKHHVEFTVTRDKVTGIAVFLREDQRIRFLQNSTQMASQSGGAPNGMRGMMGGLPGFPGGRPGMQGGMAGRSPGMPGIMRPGAAGAGGGKGGGGGMAGGAD